MKILVTGREGQVARSLAELADGAAGVELVRVGRPQFDLLDPASISATVAEVRPDVVVSAAAYTAVEQAEDEPEAAFAANATAAGLVAAAAERAGAAVIHLSTDFVFAGTGDSDHVETDATAPQSVYGRSKLEGEMLVATSNPRHVILRTAWVYSPFGRNFVKTMLRLGAERDTVRVVADQWGNPTAASDIAEAILRVAARIGDTPDAAPYGVFHLAGQGSTSWAGLARHTFARSKASGGPFAEVEEICAAEFPGKAVRPANSRLSCEKFLGAYGWVPPPWEDSCGRVVARLVGEASCVPQHEKP